MKSELFFIILAGFWLVKSYIKSCNLPQLYLVFYVFAEEIADFKANVRFFNQLRVSAIDIKLLV